MKPYKSLSIIAVMTVFFTITSCGDDFLTASSTEKQEAGAAATEGAILSNLGAAYQILLFDSYADNNYNAVLFM